jgi:hypothetical protein
MIEENQLVIMMGSELDDRLDAAWDPPRSNKGWTGFVKSLDPNIVDTEFLLNNAAYGGSVTIITFKSEEHKNWFLLHHV